MSQLWTIPGGIYPADQKSQSQAQAIGRLPLPDKLLIPLYDHHTGELKLTVAVGDKVKKGQRLTGLNQVSAQHAPTSGWISAIEPRLIAHPSGMTALCIEITTDKEDQWIDQIGYPDYYNLSGAQIREVIAKAGVVGMGGAGYPTAKKLHQAAEAQVDTIIINATECEPYITADDMLIREHAEEIIQGIDIVRQAINVKTKVIIGIENNKPEAIAILKQQTKHTDIEVLSFPTKYPSGGEKQLIQIVSGNQVPRDKRPTDIGILCLNSATIFAIKRAVINGEPLISRVTTVTGGACTINRNYHTLIGTPVEFLLRHNGFDNEKCSGLIMGGPMMGINLSSPNVPINKTSACILAPDHYEMPERQAEQACIRCGLCEDVCPASLLPQQLLWYAKAENHERLEAHNLFDCIECGACAYVCPSNIPLVHYYRNSKGSIRNANREKVVSDQAKQRFEFRKTRLLNAEQALKEKRQSRQLMMEATPAELTNDGQNTGTDAAAIIKAAQLRVLNKQASPQKKIAQLERTLLSAQKRVEEAQQRLNEAIASGSAEQQAQQRASLESARQKQVKTQQRLAEMKAQ
jgi:electron transport complex protein RnfC